jgi:hypothetical protein
MKKLPVRALAGAAFGVVSLVLLAAAFIWVHHWGAAADFIVAGWSLATVAAFAVSI